MHFHCDMGKVLEQLRALPSDAAANDVLKVEYLEVNLNNSRKLISNVSSAAAVSRQYVLDTEQLAEGMLRLKAVRASLALLDELVGEDLVSKS